MKLSNQTISIIVAMSQNGVIGHQGKIPWHLPSDLKRFKKITMGHSVIMGRKTHDSIGKPLEGRKNIVVSQDKNLQLEGCHVVCGFDKALQVAGEGEIFIIGGEKVYEQFLPITDKLYVTVIHGIIEGDASFPADFLLGEKESKWKSLIRSFDQENGIANTFEILEKLKWQAATTHRSSLIQKEEITQEGHL